MYDHKGDGSCHLSSLQAMPGSRKAGFVEGIKVGIPLGEELIE